MSYTKASFNACHFNPLCTEEMLTAYPKLNDIVSDDWWDDIYLDKLLRYIVMVYDPESPLIKGEKDLNYRKDVALDLAMVEDDEIRQQFVTCSYPQEQGEEGAPPYQVGVIIKYLMRYPKSKEWASIVATENCFWESISKLMEPISGKDSKAELEAVEKKAKIKDEIDKDIKRLDAYYKAFYGGDRDLEEQIKKRKTSPESYAGLIK